ncbi:MAG: sigma-70 family RNA polymerase sigma factor [Rectinema sp.]|jgi:RNA polymerase sigma-70 factor (ECF subfamily)|uniref:Putative RNA polymerase sigma-H factor n=1 Tax=uncultured spirochete TaxID=156406 RepID=A0A3P3XQQ7_9SPIR|nr:putative RNA polymerase sigma-H factor [uncultured spirochete]
MISDEILVRTMSAEKKESGPLTPATPKDASKSAATGDDPLDLELAANASRGDKGAFERLMWRWWDRIRGYCAAFVAFDPELAEEAAQESLIRIYKALPRWRKESPLGGYLYGICRTTSADVMRTHARHHARNVQVEEFESLSLESPHASGEANVLRQEANQLLAIAMQKLEPVDRSMLYLHEVEGKGLSELGAMYDLPLGTVKSRLFRARDKLGMLLREMGYELS